MKIRKQNFLASLVFLLLIQSAHTVFAQENPAMPGMYDIPGFNPVRDYGADQFDTIDPYMGNLKIVNTDMSIPLNGEVDIKIQRNYQPAQPASTGPLFGGQGGGRSLIGVGWDFHFGRVWANGVISPSSTATGCRVSNPKNLPVLELPDGTKQVLYDAIDADKAYITQQRWIARCLSSTSNNPLDGAPEGGLTVYSPEGLVYTFARRGYVKYAGQAYVVTQIADRNGNSVNFHYRYDNDPSGGIRLLLLDYIDGGGLSGSITFTYEDIPFSGSTNTVSKNARIKYIQYVGRTIAYQYDDVTAAYTNNMGFADGQKMYQLKQVTLPDSHTWQYTYNPNLVNGSTADYRLALQTVTTPLGAKHSYEYQWINIPALGEYWSMVSKRILKTATNVEIGNWQYSYSFSASQNAIDKTTVKTPVACIQYSHMGNASVDNLWRVGTLQDKTTYSDTSCVTALQKETYTWESELLSYDKQYLPRPTRLSIANTYLPRLSNSQIARETTTYTKTFTNYDGYGNSRNVVSQQSGQAAKTAVYTYDVKTVPWVLHLLDTEYYGFGSNPNIDRVYDGAGNLSSETVFGKTNSYAYSGGEVSSHTDPDGKLTTYSSYQMGRSTSESRPEGVSISRSVDSYGNVWLESYGALPVTKIPVGHSDLAISISYGYDNANRITSISTPSTTDSNYGISYVLGGGSNSRTITRGSSRTTESFDEWGNKTGLVREDTSAGVVNPKITTFFRYDAVGRLQYEYYPVFSGTAPLAKTYTYDALNRVKAIANNSDGSSIGYAYQADNKIVVTDEAGNPTTYSYRAFDNPDEKQLMNIAAPQGQTTTIDRNILGMINFVQQGGVTHTYGYDTRMLLTSETRPEFGTINYDRDNRGNMTARKVGSAPQAITTFVYDDLGRLTSIDYPGATPDVSRIWYNKFSKPWQVIRGDSQWDYTYDANNNLTNEALALSGAIGKTLSVQRGYDGLDQEISITYPSGKLIGEPRDALDRIQSLSQPGGLGTLVSGVKYRASGNFEQYTYGNNRATTVTESVRRWPEQFTVSGGGVADFKYTYFSTGDVSGITDYVNGSRTRTFGYDGLHRLASVTGSGAWGSAAFTYSTTGNILTKNIGGNTTTLNYDTTNRPYSITNASGTQSYGYDKYGNVISKGSQNFFYDDSSNLIWDGTTAAPPNYAYDGHNHRYWQKDAAGSETLSVYSLSGKLMYQEGKQDRSVRDYVYLDDTLVARADYCDTTRDTDGDGVPDCTEASAGTNPDVADSSLDKDGDGLTNLREYQLGTKINSADSDTDGLPDGYEVANGLNPLSSTDAHADADGDGLDNYAEYLAGTNPRNADSDGDGIVDGQDTTPLLNIAAVLVPIFYLLLN